ncbi:MAG: zinc ABC transporter substrate-binding protein [Candidatus Algichlamydia australiensis]|nr:zinc ABC transporter substrate-binding protein [Chlamydiales bacterium]
MKRVFSIFFLLLFACSSPNQMQWDEGSGKIKVLCTTAMIGDLVQQVGGDRVETLVLIQGEIDPHSYELVKGDGEKLQRADLIFYNGLGLEHGASLASLLQESAHAYNLGATLPQEKLLRVEGAVDPHIWMDVALFSLLIDPIAETLAEENREYSQEFSTRAKEVKKKLTALDQNLCAMIHTIPEEQRYLVTSHDAFNYFARRYLATEKEQLEGGWQKRFAAPEGLAPDGQLSSRHIEEIVEHLKKVRVRTLFPESNVSRDSIQKIVSVCKSAGLDVKIASQVLYGDSMGEGSYEKMMEHNAQAIEQISH